MVQTVDFRGVPLCKAGTWNGLTGKATITKDDLASVVEAYQDNEVDRARLKLGHVSELNALGDGAPAYGWVTNPRLSDDGNTLLGDLEDVPRALGGIIGKAYKNVSVELRKNVTTPSGRKHAAVLSGLALLGAAAPAVKGMESIAALYASEAPNGGPEDDCTQSESVAVNLGDALDTTPTVPNDNGNMGEDKNSSPGEPGENTQEKSSMDILSVAREAFGLDESATEDDVKAKLMALSDATEPHEALDASDKPDANDDAQSDAEDKDSIYREEIETLRNELREMREREEAKHRADVLASAIEQGRITRADMGKWDKRLREQGAFAEEMLSERPVIVNMSESGSDNAYLADGSDEDIYTTIQNTRAGLGLI